MFAPARIPVAAGKNTAKTVKKLCSVPSNVRKAGTKLVMNVSPMDRKKHPATHCTLRKKMARTESEKEAVRCAYMHNCTYMYMHMCMHMYMYMYMLEAHLPEYQV